MTLPRTFKTVYAIPLPNPGTDPASLLFNARIAGSTVQFLFKWQEATVGAYSTWQIFVTLSDGSVRIAGCVPSVCSWTAYPDYGLMVTSTLTNVGQNDLPTITLYWIVWA